MARGPEVRPSVRLGAPLCRAPCRGGTPRCPKAWVESKAWDLSIGADFGSRARTSRERESEWGGESAFGRPSREVGDSARIRARRRRSVGKARAPTRPSPVGGFPDDPCTRTRLRCKPADVPNRRHDDRACGGAYQGRHVAQRAGGTRRTGHSFDDSAHLRSAAFSVAGLISDLVWHSELGGSLVGHLSETRPKQIIACIGLCHIPEREGGDSAWHVGPSIEGGPRLDTCGPSRSIRNRAEISRNRSESSRLPLPPWPPHHTSLVDVRHWASM